jgi:uncharacterized protein YjdB
MPFTFKIPVRLALMKASLVLVAAAGVPACGGLQDRRLTGPTPPNAVVTQVVTSPDSITLDPKQTRQFLAYGRTQSGDSVAVAVRWTASGGAITPGGVYTADTLAGSYLVTATAMSSAATGSSRVKNSGLLAQIILTPATASVAAGATVQFAAYGRKTSGDSVAVNVAYTATGGTISATGLYTAGPSAGAYRVIATLTGGILAGASAVTITTVPVASVAVSPATLSVPAGQTGQLAATPKDAGGTALTGRVVTWTSSNTAIAAVNGSGLVTALAAGSATLTATSEGRSGTAAVTVTAAVPAPVATVTVSPASASLVVGATQQFTAVLKDAMGTVLTGRSVTWATSNAPVVTVSAGGVVSALVAGTATVTATSEGQSGTAGVTVTAAGGGTVLVQENFADNAFASRGWYDNTAPVVTTAQHLLGSTSALEMHFLPAATTAVAGGAMRHLFPATSTVYVSYWVKYSANWVGSGHPYHPHEFLIMSNLDGDYDGPSNGWLVAYIEHNYQNGGIPRLALQDNKAINTSLGAPPINLIGVTENRSTNGCNGVVEPNVVTTCFNMPPWYNDKELSAPQVWFQPNPGPGYKGDWNHVEAYFQINSIVGGVGQADGVMQYWFNGTLVLDRHDILFRTGARPTIQFHQFVIAPYIGDGSPVDQYMWVDNLTVATAKP